MRMRKKKNLEQKLTQCTNLIDMPPVAEDTRETVKKKEYIDLDAYFGNSNPVYLEIGCGKGQFICEEAKRNPEINFVAVEVNRSVICTACLKALDAGVKNILFVHCNAKVLEKYFKPHSVGRIYLNFSCPFPKKAYENKRLTNIVFLNIYKNILAPGAEIYQKTDNMRFFEYSIEQFSLAGFVMKNVSLDLHKSDFEGNIVTEYEKKFSDQGYRIYRLEAYLPNQTICTR